jgi:hypothetical protein
MAEPIRTTVIMKADDLGKIRGLKSSFLAQGYDLSMGQIIRLAIRELQPGGVSTAALNALLSEDGRRHK